MKISLLLAFLFLTGVLVTNVEAQTAGSLSVGLTDKSKIIERSIDKKLLLRVIKDSSVTVEDFCWIVEVVRRPSRDSSPNLIYTNPAGKTADASQVCAWQVIDQYFPNERTMKVRGYPYSVKISLVDPKTRGRESDTAFISGELKIEWTRLSPQRRDQ